MQTRTRQVNPVKFKKNTIVQVNICHRRHHYNLNFWGCVTQYVINISPKQWLSQAEVLVHGVRRSQAARGLVGRANVRLCLALSSSVSFPFFVQSFSFIFNRLFGDWRCRPINSSIIINSSSITYSSYTFTLNWKCFSAAKCQISRRAAAYS